MDDRCPHTGKPCNLPKNIHVKKTVNGEMTEYDCCQQCGSQLTGTIPLQILSMINPGGFSLFPMMAAPMSILLSNFQKLAAMEREAATQVRCEGCGATVNDLKACGKLGCPKCYETYKDQLKMLLPQMHSGSRNHAGKKPKTSNIKLLQEQMAKAVEDERYEDAAKLRDQIRELEKALKGDNLKTPEIRIEEDPV